MNNLPSLSIIIPTRNSSATLGDCLCSIINQDYPKEKMEIIIADADSTDSTRDIVNARLQSGNYKILPNPLKTGEAGKSIGVKVARNELFVLIDSDNILSTPTWLTKMVEPFINPNIIASEPLYYTYRKEDGYITRFCALLGMNDPLCLYIGNYDRYNSLTKKWTEMPCEVEDKGNYLEVGFYKNYLPTIGANGFIVRKDIIDKVSIGDYLVDIDTVYRILTMCENIKIAKVKIGIVHIFSNSIYAFIKKQRRRVREYLYFESIGERHYPWQGFKKTGIVKFSVFAVTVFPLLMQTWRGFVRTNNVVWFFHPIAVWLTFGVYVLDYVRYNIRKLIRLTGDVALIVFIASLLGVSFCMMLKNENIAEKLGNIAYFSLLSSVLIKSIYRWRSQSKFNIPLL